MPFKKCGKAVEDLLKKGYEWDRKVTLTTKTPNGVKYKTAGTLKGAKDASMSGSFEASYKHPSGFHVDKFAVSSKHQLDCDISLNEQAEGVKFTLGVVVQDFFAPGTDEKAEVGVEYKNKSMNLEVKATCDPSNNFKSYMDFLVGYESFSLGGAVKANPSEGDMKKAITDYEAKLGYSLGKDAEMTLSGKSMFSKFNLGILHKYSKDLTFGTLVEYKPADKAVAIKAGGKYKLDPEATFQGMVDKDANLSLSYSQFLRPMVKLTTSAKVDMKFVNNGEGGTSKPTSFGFCLDMGDL